MQVAVAEANGSGGGMRSASTRSSTRGGAPEALALEPVHPVASPLDTERHVGAPDRVERKVGVELETVERPKELGEREGEPARASSSRSASASSRPGRYGAP